MAINQLLSIAVIILMMVAFVWGGCATILSPAWR